MAIISCAWLTRLQGDRFHRRVRQLFMAPGLTAIFVLCVQAATIATPSYAGIAGALRGAYDYGDVNDGTGSSSKATNAGYSAEGTLSWFSGSTPANHLLLGGFYVVDSSKTLKINSSSGSLQNFSISPKGYGIDALMHFTSIFVRGGYGYYTAVARKVKDAVGRNYNLADGKGLHIGMGYTFPHSGDLAFFTDTTYRQISYGKLNVKSAPGDGLTLEGASQWNQKILSLGAGMMLTF